MNVDVAILTGEDVNYPELPPNMTVAHEESISSFSQSLFTENSILDVNGVIVYHESTVSAGEGSIPPVFQETPVVRVSPDVYPHSLTYTSNLIRWLSSTRFDFELREEHIATHGWNFVVELMMNYMGLKHAVTSEESVINLLSPPTRIDRETVESVLPTESTDFYHVGFMRSWIIDRLLHESGPLMSTKALCAHLGITVESFREQSDEFSPFKYDGIFSEYISSDSWWFYGLRHHMQDTIQDCSTNFCSVCDKGDTDVLANYQVQEGTEMGIPTHYKCSHITQTRPNPFHDIRNTSGDAPVKTTSEMLYD